MLYEKKIFFRAFQNLHMKLKNTCDLWNNAIGIPQMIIYGAVFVQTSDLILMVFQALRGGLHYSILVRISLSTVNVAFTGFMCAAFTYCTQLVRHTV